MELNEFERAQIAFEKMQSQEINENIYLRFKELVNANRDKIEKIKEIDEKYVDVIPAIDTILKHIENNKKIGHYTDIIEQRKTKDGYMIVKYKDNLGVIGVIYEGDPYITIELALRAIVTKNALIFCTNQKMYATNELFVIIIQKVLEDCGYPKDLIQIIDSENYIEMYKHETIIKNMIVIGSKDLQLQVKRNTNANLIVSGYNYFDLYIEKIIDKELIKKILEIKNIHLNIYINERISKQEIEELDIEDYTEIQDTEEAIRDINCNSAGYSSSIITSNSENAKKFLENVKTGNVFVNASPTLERNLDITEEKILYTKQIMYKYE